MHKTSTLVTEAIKVIKMLIRKATQGNDIWDEDEYPGGDNREEFHNKVKQTQMR